VFEDGAGSVRKCSRRGPAAGRKGGLVDVVRPPFRLVDGVSRRRVMIGVAVVSWPVLERRQGLAGKLTAAAEEGRCGNPGLTTSFSR